MIIGCVLRKLITREFPDKGRKWSRLGNLITKLLRKWVSKRTRVIVIYRLWLELERNMRSLAYSGINIDLRNGESLSEPVIIRRMSKLYNYYSSIYYRVSTIPGYSWKSTGILKPSWKSWKSPPFLLLAVAISLEISYYETKIMMSENEVAQTANAVYQRRPMLWSSLTNEFTEFLAQNS